MPAGWEAGSLEVGRLEGSMHLVPIYLPACSLPSIQAFFSVLSFLDFNLSGSPATKV
jgi:hypothetical protein